MIVTDSQEALQAVMKGNEARKGREALQGLLDSLARADRQDINLTLL